MVLTIPKSVRMQQAVDDIGEIIDAFGAVSDLLDRFQQEHGDELYSRLEAAFPLAYQISSGATKGLLDLMRDMTPPEDKDGELP